MMKKLKKLGLYGLIGLASVLNLCAQVNLTNGLVASYPFSGNANDISGNGYNGTVLGVVTLTSDRFSNSNSAYYFNGNSANTIDCNAPYGTSNQSLSYSFWFNGDSDVYDGTRQYPCAYVFYTSSGANVENGKSRDGMLYLSPAYGANAGRVANSVNSDNIPLGSIYTQISSTTVSKLVWHHYVSIYDYPNNTLASYIDGTLDAIITLTSGFIHHPYNKLSIGREYADAFNESASTSFKGKLDDFRMYNRVLNACEIKQLYFPFTAQPVMSTTSGTTLCKNTLLTFAVNSVAGQTYKWEAGGGGIPSPQTGNVATFKWTTEGSYVITVTAFNSCSAAGIALLYPVTITSVSGLVLTVSGPATTCVGTTGFYTATAGGSSYEWTLISGTTSTPGTDFTGKTAPFTFVTAGINYIKVRALNSCGWGDYTVFPVTVNGVITNFSISGLSTVCPNGNAYYTITGVTPSSSADAFLWVADVGISHVDLNSVCNYDRIYFPDSPGSTYNISVVGLNACGLGALKVKQVTVATGGTKPVLTCVGTGCAQLSVNTPPAGTSICWFVNSGTCTFPGQTLINRTHDVQTKVTFTNTTTGCSYDAYYFPGCSDPIPGGRLEDQTITFAQNASPEVFKLYPNPNEGSFTFETDGTKGEAFVIDMLGKIVTTIQLNENQFAYSLEIPAKSTYVLRIRTEKANKNIKFIVR